MSFQEYLKRKRFEEAGKLLLTTGRRLTDIALSCGFSDLRYMNEAFKELAGMSPRDYRRGAALPKEKGTALPSGNADPLLRSSEYRLKPEEALKYLSELDL